MKFLSQKSKDKKAISELIAYVLLIAMTITVAIIVYSWLRFQVDSQDSTECPEGLDIDIVSYTCDFSDGEFDVILRNRGRFTADGYRIRVHDRPGEYFGFYLIKDKLFTPANELKPGMEATESFGFPIDVIEGPKPSLDTVTFAEVQPYVMIKGENVFCRDISSQEITCVA